MGEAGDTEKDEFLRNPYALFLLIDRPGPFILAMIEAIAYRTPVTAYRHWPIPEVIEDAVAGFIIDGLETAIRAAERIPPLSRNHRRHLFEPRFQASRMAEESLTVYQQPIDSNLTPIYAE